MERGLGTTVDINTQVSTRQKGAGTIPGRTGVAVMTGGQSHVNHDIMTVVTVAGLVGIHPHRLDALEFWNHSRDVYLACWSGSQMLYQPLTPMFVMVVQEQTMMLVQGVIQDADQVKFIRSRF